jgi:hypothetical protein
MKTKLSYLLLLSIINICLVRSQDLEIGSPVNLTECFQFPIVGFDLTLNDGNVLNGLSTNTFSVYYFDNQADSNNNDISNAISTPTNYSTGSFALAQVWVNVVENANESNFGNSTFLLISIDVPVANNPGLTSLSGNFYVNDCDAGDTFDLTQLNANVIGSQSGNFNITYFESITDANNNQNEIVNPESFPINPQNGSVQKFSLVVRIEFDDATLCFDIAEFELNTYQQQEDDVEVIDLQVCSGSSGQVFVDLDDALVVNNPDLPLIPGFTEFTIIDNGGNDISFPNFENQVILNSYNPFTVEVSYVVGLSVLGSSFDNCTLTEIFTVFPSYTPQIQDITDIIACSAENEEAIFDLTINNALAIGDQTGNFTISYHFTLADANAGTNSVTDSGLDPTAFPLNDFEQFLFLRIENTDGTECFSVGFFSLQDADNLIALQPENTDFCSGIDEDNLTIDLTTFDSDVKGNQDDIDLIVTYFQEDVRIDTPSAFTINNGNTTITAVLSLDTFTSCFDEVSFDVSLNSTPAISNLLDLEVCTDFDFSSTFDLSLNISEAIGNQVGDFEVFFFNSLEEAENNENSLQEQGIDVENYPVDSSVETIFVRIQNENLESCFSTSFFELNSFPIEINPLVDLINCSDQDGVNAIFDLTENESFALPDEADITDYFFSYFDENDELITSPEVFETSVSQEIKLEIASSTNPACVVVGFFNIGIFETPMVVNLLDLEVCTDFDFSSTFDLSLNISEAIGSQVGDFGVSFFNSLEEAENNEKSIQEQGIDIENYPVDSSVETIFVRIQNENSESCFSTSSFELNSFPIEINPLVNLTNCGDQEDGNAIFDLTENESFALPDEADLTDYFFSYFDENDELITSPEAFETSVSQEIKLEIASSANPTCVVEGFFNIGIFETPMLVNLVDLEVCTDFDFSSTFNLSLNISEAIGNQVGDFGVFFFNSFEEAENNENSLKEQGIDIENYTVDSSSETIFVRIQNENSESCFSTSSFELNSFPSEANDIENITECLDSETGIALFDLSDIPNLVTTSSENLTQLTVNVFTASDELVDINELYEATSSETLQIEVINTANPTCVEFTSVFLEVPNPNDENCTLGITTEEGLVLEVYPNPFTNTLNISSQQPIQQVNIYNIQGKIISKISGNSLEFLDVSNLSSGVYLIQFSSSELSVTQKFIKL